MDFGDVMKRSLTVFFVMLALTIAGLKLAQKGTYIRALDLWASYPAVDFEDVLSVAHMERQGLDEILSYDKDFDRIAGVRRFEP